MQRGNSKSWSRCNAMQWYLTRLNSYRDRVLSYDFQHLPSKRMYADYYTLITEPVALDGIKSKLNRGIYSSLKSVKHDFDTCFKNAKKYNIKESQIWRDAKELHVRFFFPVFFLFLLYYSFAISVTILENCVE